VSSSLQRSSGCPSTSWDALNSNLIRKFEGWPEKKTKAGSEAVATGSSARNGKQQQSHPPSSVNSDAYEAEVRHMPVCAAWHFMAMAVESPTSMS
jgi:hypothetical protein